MLFIIYKVIGGDILIDLINKQVTHETFGKGSVVNCDGSYIKIHFESGNKNFIYPDAFKNFLILSDQRVANIIEDKIQKKDEQRKATKLKLQKKRAFKREQNRLMRKKETVGYSEIFLKSQSVFWVEPGEEELVFKEWNIFAGAIKSGQNKGEPRRLARINQNSACLITARGADNVEEGRQILGVFMVDKGFSGKRSLDGYIPAHSDYRIRLSDEESKKMLFWNYYKNRSFPQNIVWRSGRHRYFDNVWMARILQDIVDLRQEAEQKDAIKFLEYFCKMNGIDCDNIPAAAGALLKH